MNPVSDDFFAAHFDRSEMQMLLACCRRLTGNIGEEEWQARLSVPIDEESFSVLSRENRLALVVQKTLIGPHRYRFSPAFAEGFSQQARRLAMTQLALSKSMMDIHRAFSSGSVRHLFLKGPALNGLLYGAETLRSSKDLDVLIEPGNILKADALLAELGFGTRIPGAARKSASRFSGFRGKDATYVNPQAGHTVELHWKTDRVETILDKGIFGWDVHVSHVASHGQALPMMEDYHNCLYLCLHAAKHHWLRLQWLLDIAMLMRRRGMDSRRLLDLADRYGLRRAAQEALYLCRRLLRVDFGSGDPTTWEKHAAGAVHRYHLASLPVSRRTNMGIIYHRSLLYPGNGPRQGFWIEWIMDRAMEHSRKAAIWKKSSGITGGFSIPRS